MNQVNRGVYYKNLSSLTFRSWGEAPDSDQGRSPWQGPGAAPSENFWGYSQQNQASQQILPCLSTFTYMATHTLTVDLHVQSMFVSVV